MMLLFLSLLALPLLVSGQSCPLVATTELRNGLYLKNVVDTSSGIVTFQLIYEGEGWLGLGPSPNGAMINADAVIGLPDEAQSSSNPGVYRMTAESNAGVTLLDSSYQTLQDASIEQNDTHTVLTFTRSLVENDQETISATNDNVMIYAVGTSNYYPAEHGIKGAVSIALSPCGANNVDSPAETVDPPYHSLWVAHGVLMAVAWGILVPIAIGASILRDGLDRLGFAKGTWFKIHRTCNVLAVLATIAGFWVAYVAIEKGGGEHFEITHMKVGLAIFIIVLVQAIIAFMRPSLPGHAKAPVDDENVDSHNPDEDKAAESPAKKSTVRVIWEYKHRIVGIVLLGLAWYNCDTGFDALVEDYGESDDKSGVFWGVTVGISALVVVSAIALRFL